MQLMFFTDYAIRTLVYLARHPNRLITTLEVADELGIPRNHLMKVTAHLVDEGYIETLRGQHGGIRLKVPASEIRLGQLIYRAEGHSQLFNPSATSQSTCFSAVRIVQQAYDAFIAGLNEVTVADLASAPVAEGQPRLDDAPATAQADSDSFSNRH